MRMFGADKWPRVKREWGVWTQLHLTAKLGTVRKSIWSFVKLEKWTGWVYHSFWLINCENFLFIWCVLFSTVSVRLVFLYLQNFRLSLPILYSELCLTSFVFKSIKVHLAHIVSDKLPGLIDENLVIHHLRNSELELLFDDQRKFCSVHSLYLQNFSRFNGVVFSTFLDSFASFKKFSCSLHNPKLCVWRLKVSQYRLLSVFGRKPLCTCISTQKVQKISKRSTKLEHRWVFSSKLRKFSRCFFDFYFRHRRVWCDLVQA